VRLKKQALAATSVVLVTLGMTAVTATSAWAGKPTITLGPGTSINCQITAKVKLTPSLKNDWSQAAHTTDPDPTVVALPDTVFASNGPTTTSAKAKGTCTGTVSDGTQSFPVSSLKLTTSSTSGDSLTEATCSGLATPSATTTFSTTITLKAVGANVNPITTTSNLATLIDTHGVGFQLGILSATGITGTPSGLTNAYVDANTIGAILSTPSTSTVPSTSPCEATIKFKKGVATLKAPKGFKKIAIGPGAFDATPSTLTFAIS
jgi:hypothetical protein